MNCIKCKAPLPDGAVYCPACGKKQVVEKHRRQRGNGLGSAYKLPSGKWRAEKVVGWETLPLPEGSPPGTQPKKKKIVVTASGFSTKREALSALNTLTAETRMKRKQKRGTDAKTKGETITLKQLYDQWFPTHNRSKSTMNCYAAGFKLFEPLWYLPMSDIEVDDLQECLDDAETGKRTKENARACLGLVYKYGLPRNCIPKDRILSQYLSINEDGSDKKPGLPLDALEKIRALAAEGDPDAVTALCHCYLGFRPSELLALKVSDYNDKERALVGGSKTDAGIDRTVTVSPKIISYVTAQIKASESGYIFERENTRQSVKSYRAAFYALLDRIGLENPVDENGRHMYTPHSCRHTFATLLKRAQGNDTDKLALIGHSSTSQLRDYQDVNFSDLRALTDKI